MEAVGPGEQTAARRIHGPMGRGVHRYPSHSRLIFFHRRGAALVTPDVYRALLVWPLVLSLVAIFGTANFMLLSAGERVFDFRSAATSLLNLWRVLAAVIFLLSPLVLLNITADMAGVSWASAVGFVPQVLEETHAGRVFEWFLPAALVLLLSACIPLSQSIRTTMLLLLAGVLL